MDPKLRVRLLTDPKRGTPILGGIAIALVAFGFLGGLLLGHATTGRTISPATAAPSLASGPIELSGAGQAKSSAFHLSGNYRVEYNLVNACAYYGNVKRVDGAAYPAGIDLVTSTKPVQGAASLRSVPAGDYYFEMIAGAPTGCVWYVTFRAA